MFVHVVLFWMKPDAPGDAADRVADACRDLLSPLPGLTFFDVGRPAMTPREVVDNSYHVGLLTVFTDRAAHDAYQTHSTHLDFVARNQAYWDRVRIYDFE